MHTGDKPTRPSGHRSLRLASVEGLVQVFHELQYLEVRVRGVVGRELKAVELLQAAQVAFRLVLVCKLSDS